ncbi:MAG: pyridoxamine 5'-phosphate oxidase family protein [Euryarchaeota archaeon]|nr:pyridoxamine 5'-phosphate oxidase family protein [Euryarchaeota archaeon]MBU4076143.1 pyridoxamine 5'-phosphate oxidase family protein [Euryarchaeota archaeon]
MRRKDREIKDNKEIEEIINSSTICRIALSGNGLPYIIPVCFGYSNKNLYFHSANAGKKIDLIKKNNKVCFEFDIYEGLITNGNPCDWDVRYKSVIGYGKAYFIDGSQQKINALNIILRHYSDESFVFPENSIRNVTVIKVEIEELTGKRSDNYEDPLA